MGRIRLGCVLFALGSALFGSAAYAAEVCATLDTAGYTAAQLREVGWVVTNLVQLASGDAYYAPTFKPLLVCFQDPIVNLSTVLSPSAILAAVDQAVTQRQADEAAAAQRAAEFRTAIANDLCTAELTDLDARIDVGVNGITDLASAKTFLRVALKKMARCIRARAEIRR